MRAKVGANIQRLNMTDDQVNILNENLSAANSRIKDVDVAEESTRFARANILVQSGTSMLAQANMLPASALQLIG
jgi:flagellin